MVILTISSHNMGRVIYCKKKISVEDAKAMLDNIVNDNKPVHDKKVAWIKSSELREEHCMFVSDKMSRNDVFMAQIFTIEE